MVNDTQPAPRRPTIHYWGWAILIVGLASAVLIYAFARDDADTEFAREMANQKLYQHNLRLMGGTFAVVSDDLDRWFDSLWRGTTLAYTVAVFAIAIAVVCLWIGRLLSTPVQGGSAAAEEAPGGHNEDFMHRRDDDG